MLFFSDHVFEIMIYMPNTSRYDRENKCIDDLKVIQEIVKKSGMKCKIGSLSSTGQTVGKKTTDVFKQ